MFEFNAYANYQCARREREMRLRDAALLATLDELRSRQTDRPASVPARWLGLLLIRFGRTLQRWDAERHPGIDWRYLTRFPVPSHVALVATALPLRSAGCEE
jgi:hypothetical protein